MLNHGLKCICSFNTHLYNSRPWFDIHIPGSLRWIARYKDDAVLQEAGMSTGPRSLSDPVVAPCPSTSHDERRRQKSSATATVTSLPDPVVAPRPSSSRDERRRQKSSATATVTTTESRPRPWPVLRNRQFNYRKPVWHSGLSSRAELGECLDEVSVQPATEHTVETAMKLGEDLDVVSPNPTLQPRCYFSAADLSPLPHATPRKKSRKKSDSGMLVLTSSPYMKQLHERVSQKRKDAPKETPKTTKTRSRKRSAKTSSNKRRKTEVTSRRGVECGKGDKSAAEDPNCMYCDEAFSTSRPKEVWVMCDICAKWAHMECSGINKNDANFTCDFCLH